MTPSEESESNQCVREIQPAVRMKKRGRKAHLKAVEASENSEGIHSSAIGSISNGKNLIKF